MPDDTRRLVVGGVVVLLAGMTWSCAETDLPTSSEQGGETSVGPEDTGRSSSDEDTTSNEDATDAEDVLEETEPLPEDGTSREVAPDVAAHCRNDRRDRDETDTDCGGGDCPPCSPGRDCERGPDCQSGVCTSGQCRAPSCDDHIQNGRESGLDCGGSCSPCQSDNYAWKVGPWSDCSAPCEGTQTRPVLCVEERTVQPVADSRCSENKPSSERICNTSCQRYEWRTGPWGSCSASCGMGTQTRDVTCIDTQSNEEADDPSSCRGSKPDASRDCNAGDCQYEWRTDAWSTCSAQCQQTRNVFCQNITRGMQASDSECDANQKPQTSQSCTGGNCVQSESKCGDRIDNDRDGSKDCADPDCRGDACAPSGSGAVCQNSSCTETACNNGRDDDGDALADCRDPDCRNTSACTETSCSNGRDDDNDGKIDCADTDCRGEACGTGSGAVCKASGCVEQSCDDGRDNDGDGAADCADADCRGEACGTGSGAVCKASGCVEQVCDNGRDDDGDGAVDCNDSDCSSASNCTTTPGTLPPSLRKRSDLKVWLQSTNVKTIGSSVTEWTDQSGNDFDFVPGKSPSVVSNQIAGYPAVRFEGNSERLNIRNRKTNFVDTAEATIFFVFENRDGNHKGQLLSSCGVGNNQIRLDSGPRSLYIHSDTGYQDAYFSNLTLKTTQWHVMTVVLGSQEIAVYQNGQQSASKNLSNNTGKYSFNEIGNRCSEPEKLDANMAEVLLYNRKLSTSERQTVESYLQGRYNL